MHIHILGICGTFMGGIAALAKASGHRVTGCDQAVYPPMSTQLDALGIEVISGWDVGQLTLAPDMFVIGNVVSRGNPLIEAILDAGMPYMSGPEWLSRHVLRGRRVIAVAGTHGKTTTASLLAHLLDSAGLHPGFLIGGVPGNFGASARLGDGETFVVEADEYDTAFFDKRAKFVHYRPEIALLNNLEFDHADIYADLAAIEWQFHQLLRCVPRSGCVIINAGDENLQRVIEQGCWTPVKSFSAPADGASTAHFQARFTDAADQIQVHTDGHWQTATWTQKGTHNLQNTIAAIAAAASVGVPVAQSLTALPAFAGVKRRLEVIAEHGQCTVYDDFAHHPTAIRLTVAALQAERDKGRRLLVVFEPRSNTMKLGVHAGKLQPAFDGADQVFVLAADHLGWDVSAEFADGEPVAKVCRDADTLFTALTQQMRAGDRVVMMSNGDLQGLRERVATFVNEGGVTNV